MAPKRSKTTPHKATVLPEGNGAASESEESATKKIKVDEANGKAVVETPVGESDVKMEEVSPVKVKREDRDMFKFAAEIDIENTEAIGEKIESVLRSKVADRKLSTTKELLLKDFPYFTTENMEGALIYILSKKKEYEGQDLKKLISTLHDPDLIQSQELSYYIATGLEEVNEHITNGGEFSFIMCNKHGYKGARKGEVFTQTLLSKTPILFIHGARANVFNVFASLPLRLVGFKKSENNPFKELLDFVLDKIPANHFENIEMKFKVKEEAKQKKERGEGIQELLDLVPVEDQEMISEIIDTFFKEKVTDRKLSFMRESLLKRDPDATPEMIGASLALVISKKREYHGRDIKELLAKQNDPTLIPSFNVDNYFAVGAKAISEHINGGGKFHLVICNKNGYYVARSSNILALMLVSKVPLLQCRSIRDIFTWNLSQQPSEVLVGFKTIFDNPFQELVESVLEQIPDAYSKALLKFAEEQASSYEGMEIDIVASSVKSNREIKRGVIEIQDQQDILQEIESFMESKVTNHRLAWERAKLIGEKPDLTAEDIDKRMRKTFAKSREYAGRDLSSMLAALGDPARIQSSDMKSYFLVGKESIGKHLEGGEELHFIICSKNGYTCARKNKILLQAEKQSIPVLPIFGLHNMFSFDQSASVDMIVGFLKNGNSSFQQLVEFVSKKIPT